MFKKKNAQPHWNNIRKRLKLALLQFRLRTTVFKNQTLQIVQFQFSTAHFLWRSDQEFPWGKGEMIFWNLILREVHLWKHVQFFLKMLMKRQRYHKLKSVLEMSKWSSSKGQKGLSGKNDKHLGISLLLSHTELQSAAASLWANALDGCDNRWVTVSANFPGCTVWGLII